MDSKLLKHIGDYEEIYRFVVKESHTPEEIRNHLASLGVKKQTITSQIGAVTNTNPGMFRMNGEFLTVDSAKAREIVSEMNDLFSPLTHIKAEEYTELEKLRSENEELKKALVDAKKKAAAKNKSSKKVKPQVLLIDTVQAEKVEEIRDGIFMKSVPAKVDQDSYLNKYGVLREAFYKELPDEKELNQRNYQRKTLKTVFSPKWFVRRFQELKNLKNVNPKKELSVKDKISSSLHVSEEEASKQISYLEGRAISVQEILNDNSLTNQEKLALYAFNSPYRNTDLERLLNYVGDECPDANWLIALLESPDIGNNYENVKNLIRQCAKASEWKMKQRLAEELISGDWYITAVYNGEPTKFQLVPIDDIRLIQSDLGIEKSNTSFVITGKQKKKCAPKADKKELEPLKKGSFEPTYEMNLDSNEEEES